MVDTAMTDAPPAMTAERFARATDSILASVGRVIDGKPDAVRSALVCLLAEGHLLIEDVPGVGKTMLARALAASVDATVRRIQFTPDLLPGDVTGVSVFNPVDREFEFKPGAIFAQHRDRGRDQPLLPQDAVGAARGDGGGPGDRRRLDPPAAGAVPRRRDAESARDGGHLRPPRGAARPLHDAHLDGIPRLPQSEALMLRQRDTVNPLEELSAVVTSSQVTDLIAWARAVHVAPPIEDYAVALSHATRTHSDLRLGASPRATLQLVRAAKVWAALDGRGFVIPDDITALLNPVFAHRLIPTRSAGGARARSTTDAITSILERIAASVRVPIAPRQ